MNKEISLMRYVKELLDKIWLIVVLTLVCAAILFTYAEFFATPMYSSRAKMMVNNRQDGNSSSSMSSSDVTARKSLVNTYAEIIKSTKLMSEVVKKIEKYKAIGGEEYAFLQDADYTAEKLANLVQVNAANDTELFYISIQTPDPKESEFIVNAVSEYLPDIIKSTLEATSVSLLDRAEISDKPSSPNVLKYTLIGAAIGILLSAAIIFLLLMTDTVIRSEEDLTEAFEDVIVLGAIPLMHLDTEKLAQADATNQQ